MPTNSDTCSRGGNTSLNNGADLVCVCSFRDGRASTGEAFELEMFNVGSRSGIVRGGITNHNDGVPFGDLVSVRAESSCLRCDI